MASYFVLLIILAIFLSLIIWSIRNGITPMPTTKKARSAILGLIPKYTEGKIYELGSGFGTLALPLAKENLNCQVVAMESSPVPYVISRILNKSFGTKNLTIIRKDFFDVDLTDASVIVCYLYPKAMRKLKEKFEKELRQNTLVISNTFAIPGWNPYQVITLEDLYHSKVYVYKC